MGGGQRKRGGSAQGRKELNLDLIPFFILEGTLEHYYSVLEGGRERGSEGGDRERGEGTHREEKN